MVKDEIWHSLVEKVNMCQQASTLTALKRLNGATLPFAKLEMMQLLHNGKKGATISC